MLLIWSTFVVTLFLSFGAWFLYCRTDSVLFSNVVFEIERCGTKTRRFLNIMELGVDLSIYYKFIGKVIFDLNQTFSILESANKENKGIHV